MIGKITKEELVKNPEAIFRKDPVKDLNVDLLKRLLQTTDSLDKTIVLIIPKMAVKNK